MVLKRKTVSALSKKATAAASKVEVEPEEEVEDEQMQIVEMKGVEQAELKQKEFEIKAIRTKEIKSMPVSDLKDLLTKEGLKTGKKEDMIKTLLAHEAKARVKVREHEARVRGVVLAKKQELDAMSVPELNKLCASMNITGVKAKSERIERLLVQWQEADGVGKALVQLAYDERKAELVEMDEAALQKLCSKLQVDPYVTEVMVERVGKREKELGRYAAPALARQEEKPVDAEQKVDMVATLLANEANRQKEKEVKRQQEQAAGNKMKELKSMSVDDLKKALKKKGVEAEGKKEDMVEALFLAGAHEEKLAARKAELKAMGQEELKALLSSKGLTTGAKGTMVETLLAHEAKLREELATYRLKAKDVLAKKQKELEAKSNKELKELCESKGLEGRKLGKEKEERVERLLEEAESTGEVSRIIAIMSRQARRKELEAMDKPTLVKLCQDLDVDPIVKDVMIERVLSRENEDDDDELIAEPATKKRRA